MVAQEKIPASGKGGGDVWSEDGPKKIRPEGANAAEEPNVTPKRKWVQGKRPWKTGGKGVGETTWKREGPSEGCCKLSCLSERENGKNTQPDVETAISKKTLDVESRWGREGTREKQ